MPFLGGIFVRFRFAFLLLLSIPLAHAQIASINAPTPTYRLPSLLSGSLQLDLQAPLGILVTPSLNPPSVEQLLQSPLAEQFKPWQPGMPLPTSSNQDVWLRIQVPQQISPQSWMLRIPRPTLEKATLFQRSLTDPSQWIAQSAGTDLPNTQWPIRSRDPVFEITTRTDQTQIFFIQIKNSYPITENILLIRSTEFVLDTDYADTLDGAILGIFTMLTLAGVISSILNRNSHFGWYALFCFLMMVTQLAISGYLFLKVWPNSIYLAQTMNWVLHFFSLATLARFIISVSYAKDISRSAYFSLWLLIGICLLLILTILIFPRLLPRAFLNLIFISGMLAALGSLASMTWRSQHWLWIILISTMAIVCSALSSIAYNVGLLTHIEPALLYAMIVICMSMITIYASLVAQQRQRASIAQRESDLEVKDQATGLFTERIARERLPRMLVRGKRQGSACAAILVRWVNCDAALGNTSSVNRGRILSHLGDRLNHLGRDIDTVARLSDDQFIFLLEAPVTRDQLSSLATQILASGLRPSAALEGLKGYDLHIAVWLSSDEPVDAVTAIELLQTRISQMQGETQRRIQFVSSNLSTTPHSENSDPEHTQKLIKKINSIEKSLNLSADKRKA
jgi:two-component system, sensor histidine kinase LadS